MGKVKRASQARFWSIECLGPKQPNKEVPTLGLHKELTTKRLLMDFVWRPKYG
jgi:hypothetical protein